MTSRDIKMFVAAAIAVIICWIGIFLESAPCPDAETLLARSCVGEAGWMSTEEVDGECAAILNIYRKRMKFTGMDLIDVVKRYSSAVKRIPEKRNAWIHDMNRECLQPANWPRSLDWQKYQPRCLEAFKFSRMFLGGGVPDPLPDADHYGSRIDHHRTVGRRWKKLATPRYRNWFYQVMNRKAD